MIQRMIFQNVLHRPIRTALTILAVAIEVMLVIIVVGLTTGLVTDSARRVEGIGADIMVQPLSASVLMAFSGAPMPIALGGKLGEMKYVKYVAPVLLQFNSTNGLDIIYGIDPASYKSVSGGFVFHSGHELEQTDDILVDDWYARSKHIATGQTLHILDHDFHVAGVVEHGKGARLFVMLSTLQDLAGATDKASIFFIKCERPDDTDTVIDEIRALLPRYEIRPLKDFLSLMTTSNLPGLSAFVNTMIGLAVAIGFLVIFLSMYTTIVERTREIGVLKSLGASKSYIIRVILSETTLLCVAGTLVGIGLSVAARAAFLHLFPTLTILISFEWILRAAIIAIIGGLVGSSYPAWLASSKDPVEALAYE